MISKEELGLYLKSIRQAHDISLREVDKRIGISYTHLNMIENGKRNVTPALLRNLANLYNINYLDLYEKAGYIDLIEDEKKSKYKIDKLGNPITSIPILRNS
jgi:transcriptional regulator with XRE-family HTH domain